MGEPLTLHKTFDPKVTIVADAISPAGIRITTLQFRQPRMIHADFMAHRVFSRNARSSRAVPTAKLLAEDPYIPHFLKNKPGMVASEEFAYEGRVQVETIWRRMLQNTRLDVAELDRLGVHKQWANRPLEWFGFIDVLVTSTDWANYLALRTDEAAQPEIQQVANAIGEALATSTPKLLNAGDWHLPYIREEDYDLVLSRMKQGGWGPVKGPPERAIVEVLKKLSAARCARLSIKPFDGLATIEAELARYEKLVGSMPMHMSPLEHQATPDTKSNYQVRRWVDPDGHDPGYFVEVSDGLDWDNPKLHGNFTGWIQYRKTIPNEHVTEHAVPPLPVSIFHEAVEPEPVAWRYRSDYDGVWEVWYVKPPQAYLDRHPETEPLYAAPPPAADVAGPLVAVSPADAFADWINAGPLLAAAAGKHVSMQVTDTASTPVSTAGTGA